MVRVGKSIISQKNQNALTATSKLTDTTVERNNKIKNDVLNNIKIMNEQLKSKKRSVLTKRNIAEAIAMLAGYEESSSSSSSDSSDYYYYY